MPNCRNCGARLSKFDADICPVCGAKKPLEGVNSETIEITSQIDLNNFTEGQKVVRRRKTLLILFLTVGFTGTPFFYLKKKKLAIIWLLINLVLLGGLLALFLALIKPHVAISILIPILVVYLLNCIMGAIYRFLPDLKDGEGAFVV